MSKILELYSYLDRNENGFSRFVDEIFRVGIYRHASPQLTVVDIGAFQGEYGYYVLPFAKVVYAIEPDPGPYNKMVDIIKNFHLSEKIKPYQLVITGKDGKRAMKFTGDGGSSLADRGDEVESLSLNSFLKRENIESVDILKIDVESSEMEIFTAEDFLEASKKIKYIIGEVHAGEGVRNPLEACGFQVYFRENCFTAEK